MSHGTRGLTRAAALGIGLVATSGAFAGERSSPFSVGVGAGTGGIGAELTYRLGDRFDIRATGSYFKLSHDVNTSNIRYEGKLRPYSFGLLADFYPFESAFRISGGATLNRNLITLVATPTGTTIIGSQSYTPAQLGQINGRVAFRDIAPYAGLGVTTNRNQRGLGFIADAGVMFSGRPRVNLTATGSFASDPTFQSNLALEQERVRDKIDWLKHYPIVRIGLVYHF